MTLFLVFVLFIAFSHNTLITGQNLIPLLPSREEILSALASLAPRDPQNSTKCDLQLQAFVTNVFNFNEMWAIQMFDAWGKWPAGILEGNTYEIGNYDECLKISHESQEKELGHIRGQYCQMSIPLSLQTRSLQTDRQPRGFPSAPSAFGLMIGTCFPSTCEANYLEIVLNNTFGSYVNVSDMKLECANPIPDIGTKEIVAIVIFSIVASLLLLSTLYDIFARITSGNPTQTLIMFSIYSNGLKLLTITGSSKAASHSKSELIDCLNGIRVLSMAWIVFSHNYMMLFSAPLNNRIAIYDWIQSYHSMLVVASTVSVDSFFLLSGMLVCWSIMKELDKNRKINVPVMYLHRYLRLTPALAALILFSTTLLKYVGSGPFWNQSWSLMEASCDKYWWSALLYVQNYVNPKQICLGHSWYLSVDMQLYIISPLIIYPLWKWGRKVLLMIAGLILLAVGCVMAIFLVKKLRLAYVDVSQTEDRSRMILTYFPTHTRMGAWLVGVILGYVLHQTKHTRVRLSRIAVACGWFVSIALMMAILFGDYPLQQPDTYADHPLIVDAIYESTNRVVWASCLGWIVFACVNGYGGPINTFLSLSVWQPLGRLSYSIYLLHLVVQQIFTGSLKHTVRFNDVQAVHKFWGDFGLTVTLAILWSLAFESPIVGLEKLLFRSVKKPSPKQPLVEAEQNEENGSTSTVDLSSANKL